MQLRAWPWRPRKMVARLWATVWTKMPAFHWRHLVQELERLFHWGGNHRLVLSLPNSYTTDDRVAVHVWTDDGGSQSQAKAQVCLVELLLHAPHHGAVPLLAGA